MRRKLEHKKPVLSPSLTPFFFNPNYHINTYVCVCIYMFWWYFRLSIRDNSSNFLETSAVLTNTCLHNFWGSDRSLLFVLTTLVNTSSDIVNPIQAFFFFWPAEKTFLVGPIDLMHTLGTVFTSQKEVERAELSPFWRTMRVFLISRNTFHLTAH